MNHILIDARINGGQNGGIEQAIYGLAESFSSYKQDKFRFTWLCYEDMAALLKPLLGEQDEIQVATESPKITHPFAKFLRNLKIGNYIIYLLRSIGPFKYKIPSEPDVVSRVRPDLIHFPTQFGFRTDIPNLYQPHDFQHRWYPQYFTMENLYLRNYAFSNMIQQANIVCLGNTWTLGDFENWYPEYSSKGFNVPVFPQGLKQGTDIVESLDIQDGFLYYPSAFWIHKNHNNLLNALCLLKNTYPTMKLVLTGSGIQNSRELKSLIESYGLVEDVIVLGYLERSQLSWLYSHALAVVMPSKFESESLPVWEALAFGVPVACSNITALPAQVGGAALIFDPESPQNIADTVSELISREELRKKLSVLGKTRFKELTPQNSALGYLAAYSKALGGKHPEIEQAWEEKGFVF